MSILSVIKEEIQKLEGVGDKYLQNKGIMPDDDDKYMSQTQAAIKDESMGEMIGYTRVGNPGSNKIDPNSPIYKNPTSLNNFENGVRAVSDKQGNLYVGQINGDYAHGGFEIALGVGGLHIYDVRWGITWQRIKGTNKFGLADSSAGYPHSSWNSNNVNVQKIFQENLDIVRKRNPQYEFIPEIYYEVNEVISEEVKRLFSDSFYEQEDLYEVGEGDKHQPYDWHESFPVEGNIEYLFTTEDGDEYEVQMQDIGNYWNIDFKTRKGNFEDVINKGRFFRVMATIAATIKDFLIKTDPELVRISPAKNSNADQRRFNIYKQYFEKQLPSNYEVTTSDGYIYVQHVLDEVAEDIDRHSSNLLYHVTSIENLEDVKKYGLLPQFGETVKQAYADYYKIDDREDDPEDYDNQRQELEFDGLLFFSEKPMLQYAHAGLGQYDLKWNEVLLCVVEKNDSIYHKVSDYPRFTDYRGEEVDSIEYMSVYDLPIMIETGDWFSFEEQAVEDLLYGERLREFMQNNFEAEAQRLVAEEIQKLVAEGLGDKYAQQKFGIPDSGEEFEAGYQQHLKSQQQDAGMGEKVGEFNTETYIRGKEGVIDGSTGGFIRTKAVASIYKNPKSFEGFDPSVRAISTETGDLYVADINGDFTHSEMGMKVFGESVYKIQKYVTWYRIKDSNNFTFASVADSQYRELMQGGFPEHFYERFVNGIAGLRKKYPQSKFYIVGDAELKEGVGDKYAKQFGIDDEGEAFEKRWQQELQRQQQNSENGVLAGVNRLKNGERTNIYLNPKSLVNFDKSVRAISDKDGNLYVAQDDNDTLHTNIGAATGLKRIADPNAHILWERFGGSNKFVFSYGFNEEAGKFGEQQNQMLEKRVAALKAKNPNYGFQSQYFDYYNRKTNEGTGDRYAEKIEEDDLGQDFVLIKKGVLDEIGEANIEPYPWDKENTGEKQAVYQFVAKQGSQPAEQGLLYEVFFRKGLHYAYPDWWYGAFQATGYSDDETTDGNELQKIMATIVEIMKAFVREYQPLKVIFEPSKVTENDQRRLRLYMAYIQKNLPSDYQAEIGTNPNGGQIIAVTKF